jgi:hypothetical protein
MCEFHNSFQKLCNNFYTHEPQICLLTTENKNGKVLALSGYGKTETAKKKMD